MGKQIMNITPQDAFKLIKENIDNPDFVLLDVRTPGEFSESHIEGAILLNYQSPDFRNKVQELDKNKTYLVYCRSGMRSSGCASTMNALGFENIYNISGGIMEWQRQGLPLK
ncbi:rhodanese-like domain-containing protein [Methanobacterium sp.]|uniref:rhodanese-like domain-containing protein n=1 Tax=Methanobacterium sp. TaxID=2164 RepID=UPI0025E7B942|nr:rhodanese-like domain-containing protein [Methanobacterium sp.]MBI5460478.1 rhodanese-like domain-containing protein [Methanobacterium sp.]